MKVFGAVIATVVLAASAYARSPFDGKWKIDLASTKQAPHTQTLLIRHGVYACASCTPSLRVRADGVFHSVAGRDDLDATLVRVMDARSVRRINRLHGRVVREETMTLSPGGKTATLTFTDTINLGIEPVTGRQTLTRVAAGPPGAHALSGTWRWEVATQVSDNALTESFRIDGDTLTFETGEGFSYTATLDGTPATTRGDPSVDSVSVRRVGERELTEVDSHQGAPVARFTYAVSADGATLAITMRSERTGRITSMTAHRQ